MPPNRYHDDASMAEEFQYDVFLSHSARDKAVVRELAERLRKDGVRVWFDEWVVKPGDSIPVEIEEGLERSRVLVLCMSANAFGSEWARLESGTFHFRDPLNKQRRFLPLRLDDAPIKGSLAQFRYIDWRLEDKAEPYAQLLDSSRRLPLIGGLDQTQDRNVFALEGWDSNTSFALGSDLRFALSGLASGRVTLWDLELRSRIRSFVGHKKPVACVGWNPSQTQAASGSSDASIRVWDVETGKCLCLFAGHTGGVTSVAWSPDGGRLVSGAADTTARVWEIETGVCPLMLIGHSKPVRSVAWSGNGSRIISGSEDGMVRIWDTKTGECIAVLDGHTKEILSVVISASGSRAVSSSSDRTIRFWDVDQGQCLRILEGHTASIPSLAWNTGESILLSGCSDGFIFAWHLASGRLLRKLKGHQYGILNVQWHSQRPEAASASTQNVVRRWYLADLAGSEGLAQIEYTNAKVLVVGDTHSGKTALTHRLATRGWMPSEDSTVGAWSTQWQLKDGSAERGVDREIWLWDFGGQADQRLIHQLYMDRTALILLLFNADQEDVLPGLRDWQAALRRCVHTQVPHFLVAGRIDAGFKASRAKLQDFAQEQGLAYYETSAKSGEGCDGLRAAMIAGIPWSQMEKRTSPRIFKLIKDEVLKLRDEGQVLHTFKELRELLWRRLPDEPRFTDDTLQTVIGLLDGPGAVKELDYGTYILLAPEWINAYAQAVIRTLRSAENDLGVLPLRSIAEGKLIYQSIGRDGVAVEMKRLPPAEERVVLGEMERQLEQRGLCLRQGDKLVFPSHCGRDRPTVLEHPSVFVSYAVKGFLDDIYATLVVKLADSESFHLKELWRDAADFVTLAGDHHMGLKLTRESGSEGEICVYFGKGVTQEEQVIFANYIDAHLERSCEHARRLRHYVCPNCHAPKGNADVLMKKLLRDKEKADTECDGCGERFPLWDALEKKFSSVEVMKQVIQLHVVDSMRFDARRKGKLLALEVGSRITSADQKCFEVPATEDEGIDMELEFTTDEGKGTGKRLYLQLKSGNSHLEKRKDGREIFAIREQRWVEYWLAQKEPVMLVIGTFSEEDERAVGKEKLEFADVRWMEISSILRRETQDGTRRVKQIEFRGERLDLSSVRRWRARRLGEAA